MKKLKIGITIGLKSNEESIWSNGIKQNVLVLYRLLKNSKLNYDVYLLNTFDIDWTENNSTDIAKEYCIKDINEDGNEILIPKYLKDIKFVNFSKNYLDMDLMICMGSQIHNSEIEKFKASGENKKIIGYKCGNNYVITMENIIFKESSDTAIYQFDEQYDEIWYVPQQDEVNKGYYNTLYRTNATIVPFIWHNKFLLESLIEIESSHKKGIYKKGWQYDLNKEKKKIGIMEPNINIVKFCLIPSMIAEQSYRSEIGKNKIDGLMLTNAMDVAKHREFMGMIKTFDLYKDNKITAEGRFQTAFILTQHIDILVCHQLLNPLNYLYLDAAYMGYPVLHNAPMCKDIGYYYEGSDTLAASEKLNWILENHDSNIDEYNKRNDKVLERYYADNSKLVKIYDDLIFNLFNGGNHGLIYNETTNGYTVSNIKNKVTKRKPRTVKNKTN